MYCVQLLCYCQSLALAKYSHTLRNTRVLYEVLRTVQRQRIGNAVFLGVLHYITLEEAKVDNMDFRIVLHGKLGKGVAVGIFNKHELAALAAALNDGLCLVEVQKHSVLVTAGQVFAFVNTFCFILAIVIGNMAGRMLIPCGDLLGGDIGQGDLIPSCAVGIIAEDFLCPLVRIRLDAPPRTIAISS